MPMRLGCNTVVFAGASAAEAVRCVQLAGFGGVEFASLPGSADHLTPDDPAASEVAVEAARAAGLELVACEAATNLFDPAARERVYRVFSLCGRLGVPVVTTGSAGASTPESLEAFLPLAREVARQARDAGVVWACKPHVGAAVYSTETALALVRAVADPALGINYDPTHLQRVGEDVVRAAAALAPHTRHVHIRDYSSPDTRIGPPELQTAGRGLVDLPGALGALHAGGYRGHLDLEVIGSGHLDRVAQMAIAAGSWGYLTRILREIGA
jgi:sugar phosphate isomerase/epimerase